MTDQVLRLRHRLTRAQPEAASAAAAPGAVRPTGPAAAAPPPQAEADDVNNRKAPRKTSRLPGYISVDGRQRLINCEVLDMSATGACVRVALGDRHIKEEVDSFPDYVKLFITYDRVSVECKIMWRNDKDNEMGVRFLKMPQTY